MKYFILILIYTSNIYATDLSILNSVLKDIDVKEYKSKKISNPKINAYHASTGYNYDDNIAWCASFLNFHVKKVGYKGTNSPSAGSWRSFGIPVKAQVGAIAVMPRYNQKGKRVGNHVGVIKKIKGNKIWLVGGNQGKTGHGKVSVQQYDKKRFDSFRVPRSKIVEKTQNKNEYFEYEEMTNSMGAA